MSERLKVAVAGASGFVGERLVDRLCGDHEVFALGRSVEDGASWRGTAASGRRADLFSLRDAEEALEGVDVAYYLVHSMMPSARLTQATFEDMDAILADNFGRAAARAGVRQIIYLGGLLPQRGALSAHLRSRAEVERLLSAHGVPVTVLRAGLVVGPDGSSFRILRRLVKRLPVLVCPRWTRTETQPIALADMVELLARSAGREETFGEVFDVGGADVLTYREMMLRTAALLDCSPMVVDAPVLTPGLSTLWVTLVTGASRELVGPLVESLKQPMIARDNRLACLLGVDPMGFDESVRATLEEERAATALVTVRQPKEPGSSSGSGAVRDVRSIQRLPQPLGLDAKEVTHRYLSWLPAFCRPWLRVAVTEDGFCSFRLALVGWLLLELRFSVERSSPDRALLYITGGKLARVEEAGRGRLEFRLLPGNGGLLAAIHDFTPALPWYVYRWTQAWVHLVVMRAFGRHLKRLESPMPEPRST